MLNSLLTNHQLKGLSYGQFIDLLGEAERHPGAEAYTLTYTIATEYGRNIEPVYRKNLEIHFGYDSIVTEINTIVMSDTSITEIRH